MKKGEKTCNFSLIFFQNDEKETSYQVMRLLEIEIIAVFNDHEFIKIFKYPVR